MKTLTFVFAFIFSAALFAQSPDKSAKLVKEQGFNLLKPGAKYSVVKSVLQKDTINRNTSLEPKSFHYIYNSCIYLVNLKTPGYSTFMGRPIDRIEVFFKDGDSGENEIDNVKIYFKKKSEADTDNYFAKLLTAYGNVSIIEDFPEKGYDTINWYSPLVLMTATSYYGDLQGEMKIDYFKIEFYSAVGG